MGELDPTPYWLPDELESVDQCPVCQSSRSAIAYEGLRDELEGVPGEWSMRRCLSCGSFYLGLRPKALAIGKAYASYYTHVSGLERMAADNGTSFLWRLSNGYMNARFGSARAPASFVGRIVLPWLLPLRQQLDFFYRHLPGRPGKLLDVGCGNGIFLLRAKDAGWDVQGIEPDPMAVAAARRAGLDVIEGTLDAYGGDGDFDVVTTSHVIEHVHDPRRFVEQMFALLRPGGRLWIATPNAQSLGHRHFGHAWRGLEPPRHITVLTQRALRELLESTGFRQIRNHRRGRGSGYILRASMKLAERYGSPATPLSNRWVDLLATCSAALGEECVVSAVKGWCDE
ncbi:class I SAM-dependent methyltransferase [Dyella telluris]|uniref:Class I SAM-dependent methyltransferase n=1 Tax=Dyella telluris TaxID=2763498 RepID=A0A7G8Q0R6_9GAMM|nr:class I SAM-dependent methyltransferase [Dyella telluris]QNK00374.1 class I SAM-dependent methyltransferase [Dyella telluris]